MTLTAKRCLLLLFVPLLFVLGACSDFDEMKSQKLYNQAQRQFEEGQELEAEAILVELLNHYPRTQMASKARRQLDQIHRRREMRERAEFARILDSYRQVLNGYRSVYAEYPKSIEEFDSSGFFFDTAYLEEITIEGFQTYLWLKDDGRGYRVWCIREEKERGYAVGGNSRELVAFDRQEKLAYLEQKFAVSQQIGRLLILVPRS